MERNGKTRPYGGLRRVNLMVGTGHRFAEMQDRADPRKMSSFAVSAPKTEYFFLSLQLALKTAIASQSSLLNASRSPTKQRTC